MSMNPIAAPKTLRYEPDAGLPVAIEAKSNRRYFYPTNGDKFGPNNTNVIRMTLNANSFLDFSHSYLQFTFENKTGAQTVGLDHGVPFFSRLQIMSGGQELEDIQEYSRLYSILSSIQGSRLNADENSLTQGGVFGDHDVTSELTAGSDATGTSPLNTDGTVKATLHTIVNSAIQNAVNDHTGEGISYLHNENTQIRHDAGPTVSGVVTSHNKVTYNVPIISAFFNIDKYFPLLLTEQGIDLYFYLEGSKNIGCWSGDPADPGYEINNVRYVAHEVNLDDAFVNQMKASMQATGGVLSLSSTTYRYNQITGVGNINQGGQEDLSISCRVKSLKGMLVRPQMQCMNNDHTRMAISTGQACGIEEAQFRIGSVLYPQSAIKFSNDNRGELFQEIRKCFGTIGSYAHGTLLNSTTVHETSLDDVLPNGLNATDDILTGCGEGTRKQFWLLAYDFETFAKSATESGINVSDRALPVSLQLKRKNAGLTVTDADGTDFTPSKAIRYDTFAMCDCIIYIDLMGKITTRI